jgi:hypothetical protein
MRRLEQRREPRRRSSLGRAIDADRDAVRAFAAGCNAAWLIGKNRFCSPLDARAAWLDTTVRRAA